MQNNDEKNKQDRVEGDIPPDSKIHGRVAGSENPHFKEEDDKRDISAIDRQEGEMNNGAPVADTEINKED